MTHATRRLQFRLVHLLWAVVASAMLARFPVILWVGLWLAAYLAVLVVAFYILAGPMFLFLRMVGPPDPEESRGAWFESLVAMGLVASLFAGLGLLIGAICFLNAVMS